MSQSAKNKVISIPSGDAKNTARCRKRAERARRRAAGQVAVTVHVHPDHRAAVRVIENILNSGGGLALRLLRYLDILSDWLPARVRQRRRLPKVTVADARRAGFMMLIGGKS